MEGSDLGHQAPFATSVSAFPASRTDQVYPREQSPQDTGVPAIGNGGADVGGS
jgi:hypothetical protein